MVTLTHLKRQGGATTHQTHDISTRERISQRLENLVQVANSTREIIGTVMAQKIGL
jgi:ribosomal protein S7